MVEEVKEQKEQPTTRPVLYQRLKFIAVLLAVVCLGLLAVNLSLSYIYKAEFLAKPCDLCAKINVNQSGCIKECFTKEVKLFPDGRGNWYREGEGLNLSLNLSAIK